MRLSNIALAITSIYGGFSPANLFAGGVAGAWYDPSDLSTMFTTSVGTTPVAMPGLGSAVPVGLMLDKSQGLVGLGTQLVVNGDFSTGNLTNWQSSNGGSFALSSNRLQVTGAGANTTGAAYTLNTTVGAAYAVSFVVTLGTATVVDSQMSLSVAAGAGIGNSYQFIASNQTITYYFVATAATTYFQFMPRGTGLTAFIDDFSVKTLGLGNHAIAFNNTTARPELRARVNLLTYSEEFQNGAWTKNNSTAANTTATTDPLGGTTADVYTNTGSGDWLNTASAITIVAGLNYTYSIYAKRGTQDWLRLSGWNDVTGTGTTQAFNAWFNLATGAKGTLSSGADGTAVSHDMVSVGNGWYRCTVVGRSTALTTLFPELNMTTADAVTTRPATGNEVYIWGADLRPANIGANVPAYQRIADANTYDTNGFPLYLRLDGIDDGMYTPANLDLSNTAQVAVFAGVRKLSDAQMAIAELSANVNSNNGVFGLFNGFPSGTDIQYGGGGTAKQFINSAASAPTSRVISGISEISGASTILRLNGVQVSSSSASLGTGNFGSYPLYIGARNNSSLWLNGQLYSLAVVGSAVSAGNIAAMESWVAGRTGIQI